MVYKQVDGIEDLKKAIEINFLENHLSYNTDNVTVGVGKHVIYNLFMATVDLNDEVIIPAPIGFHRYCKSVWW